MSPVKLKKRILPLLRENSRIITQSTLTILFLAFGIWFIKHERTELIEVQNVLLSARWQWVLAGIMTMGIYLQLQGQMYVYSFASVHCKVSLFDSTILFIKRNFISVFLPAGGISSLAFFSSVIEGKGIKKTQIHFASSIYAFIGILSVLIVAIPAFFYAIAEGSAESGEWYALGAIVVLIAGINLIYRTLVKHGIFYHLLLRWFPASEVYLNDLLSNKIDRKQFLYTVLTSVAIEFVGIAHLYIAMIALHYPPSLPAAVMGYIISVIFLMISPFLRGLGAIEVSMSFILIRFGFGNVEAIAVTFLYRFFEFWMPLFAGVVAFVSKVNKLLLRILPALFLMGLGILNIISVLMPAISERLIRLKDFLPVQVIHASNYLVMVAGLFLLVTAAFLLKGLRSAWWFALVLSILSFIGHITKAIDYEEAIVALISVIVLVATHREYYIRSNTRLRNVGLQTALLVAAAVLVYGIVGFYFLDKNHFNTDFNLMQSIRFTFQNFVLIGSDELVPADRFARDFIYSINISGFLSISFLIYTLLRSYRAKETMTQEEFIKARDLLKSFGNSSLDYFKMYDDKMIFISEGNHAFISYRISGNYAVVLENPVAGNGTEVKNCIREFDRYCYDHGLKSIFYRVPEESLELYRTLRKKELFIGQEGIVDLTSFSLEGTSKKSLRNAMNKMAEGKYRATIHLPPVKDVLLQKIKSVSDEWLADTGRTEIIFSQGMFRWEELKNQPILTLESAEEKVVAFLNIISDYSRVEATYDLIRKTRNAPNGVMDFILIELFRYLKSRNFAFVNLGFAPMSGLNDPHTFPERSMKFAYEKIRSFSHYKGLREYKEKFEPEWYNKYLVYQHDYDLLNIPSVLANVIKP